MLHRLSSKDRVHLVCIFYMRPNKKKKEEENWIFLNLFRSNNASIFFLLKYCLQGIFTLLFYFKANCKYHYIALYSDKCLSETLK